MVLAAFQAPVIPLATGFSFSPGGLLLPYHLGVIDALKYKGAMTDKTPIAGSSAGAIAVGCTACQLDSLKVLDATVEISDRCREMGGARGRLLPLLREKMDELISHEDFDALQEREGETVIAYRELFPNFRPVLQKEYEDRHDLSSAISYSSMFPFFATNWPVALDRSNSIPRLVVDGFFSVPRERFGCPCFEMADVGVDRTVTISVFPRDIAGLEASKPEDCISPASEGQDHNLRLLSLATESSSRKDLTAIYESGWADAEEWCHKYQHLHIRDEVDSREENN